MIRLATFIRVAPAAWLAIPICLLAGFYVTLLAPSDRYAVDATAKATAVLPFVGAFCAACAAWEASRLRRARIWAVPWVRSKLEVALWCVAPTVFVGVLALGVAVGHQLLRSNAVGAPDFQILAVGALDLAAYAAVGFALGLALPFAIAGPLAIVGTIIWLAFIPAMEPIWLRHLTGMFRDCCGLSEKLAIEAVVASTLVDLALLTAAALAIAAVPRRAAVRRSLGAFALVAALFVAASLVDEMGYAPSVPRDVAALACDEHAETTVCVWPEHAVRATEVGAIAAGVVSRWHTHGVNAPTGFTEATSGVQAAGGAQFAMRGDASTDDIIAALSAAMLPPFPDCFAGFTGEPAFQYLEAWYAYAGGMSSNGWLARYETDLDPLPSVSAVVKNLADASSTARQEWTRRAEAVSQACGEWEPSLLAVEP